MRFATEIAALAAGRGVPAHPRPGALRGYLRFGSFTSPETPFREIRKVPPAPSLVRIDARGATRRRRYWRWHVAERAKQPAHARRVRRGLPRGGAPAERGRRRVRRRS